jgi:hypothetical protein
MLEVSPALHAAPRTAPAHQHELALPIGDGLPLVWRRSIRRSGAACDGTGASRTGAMGARGRSPPCRFRPTRPSKFVGSSLPSTLVALASRLSRILQQPTPLHLDMSQCRALLLRYPAHAHLAPRLPSFSCLAAATGGMGLACSIPPLLTAAFVGTRPLHTQPHQ